MPQRTDKKTICLNMIVKNEAAIIWDTLENIIAHISLDYYVISDTGSDDNTAEIIEQFFAEKGIKGEIHHDEWVSFAHNRNCALQHAQGKTDYVLIFDADDRFEGNFVLPEELTSDRYYFRMANNISGSNVYFRTLMFRNDGSFYWRSPEDEDLKDRYAFYTAQSYRDADMYEKAIEWYAIRANLGGWYEEVYHSLLQISLLKIELNAPLDEIQRLLLATYEYRPQRAESLYHLARQLRYHNKAKQAYIYATVAANIPLNKDILFVDHSVYEWKAKEELAISSNSVGNYQLCHDLCVELLFNPVVPEPNRKLLLDNLKLAKEHL